MSRFRPEGALYLNHLNTRPGTVFCVDVMGLAHLLFPSRSVADLARMIASGELPSCMNLQVTKRNDARFSAIADTPQPSMLRDIEWDLSLFDVTADQNVWLISAPPPEVRVKPRPITDSATVADLLDRLEQTHDFYRQLVLTGAIENLSQNIHRPFWDDVFTDAEDMLTALGCSVKGEREEGEPTSLEIAKTILNLTGFEDRDGLLEQLPQEQLEQLVDWASAVSLVAGDNYGVIVPNRPAIVDRLTPIPVVETTTDV